MSFVFSESLIRGIALIRFFTSSLVAPNSSEDNSFGLVSTVCPELSPESGDFCELGFWWRRLSEFPSPPGGDLPGPGEASPWGGLPALLGAGLSFGPGGDCCVSGDAVTVGEGADEAGCGVGD